ncbi:MAG: ABC-ATPase domain-containing protein [Bacteroidota bacterium]
MQEFRNLYSTLNRINRKGYKAYKDLEGAYTGEIFDLYIDHVQGDPFAAPSRFSVRVDNTFPEWSFAGKSRKTALSDFLTRRFFFKSRLLAKGNRGSGKSGMINIEQPGQELLERTSVIVEKDYIEARFVVGLPAYGRKVAAEQAREMIDEELTLIVKQSLFFEAVDHLDLQDHIYVNEDADLLRKKTVEAGFIAFVSDDAILPRASGIDQRPLADAIAFQSPQSMRVEFQLQHRKVTGMAIPQGVTLIVGGGYHGKSTLLSAIERGVYNHIPGDGREFVVADETAMKIRAEDGRYIEKVDISPFINSLPFDKDTVRFSSDNASGSTSQAANTIEALESGSKVLMIDEDTSATNFMIRDKRMQQLVPKNREPITPYIDKVHQLYQDYGVSTILVVGGSGSYFEVADKVICMVEYLPFDLTEEAKAIVAEDQEKRVHEGGDIFGKIRERIPQPDSIDPSKGHKTKLKAEGVNQIQLGRQRIDLSALDQVVSPAQLNAIADAILLAKKRMGKASLKEVLHEIEEAINQNGLDILNKRNRGDYAMFRKNELAAALNRLRTFRVK